MRLFGFTIFERSKPECQSDINTELADSIKTLENSIMKALAKDCLEAHARSIQAKADIAEMLASGKLK